MNVSRRNFHKEVAVGTTSSVRRDVGRLVPFHCTHVRHLACLDLDHYRCEVRHLGVLETSAPGWRSLTDLTSEAPGCARHER
jgi:hypothetical protein